MSNILTSGGSANARQGPERRATSVVTKPSVVRIINVTLGLSIVGLVVGGTLGAFVVTLLALRVGHLGRLSEPFLLGAVSGAAMGFVLAPTAAWTLLRHVPFWRAITETARGTVIGAGIGLAFQPMHDANWLSPLLLGTAGFSLASLRLRWRSRFPPATAKGENREVVHEE